MLIPWTAACAARQQPGSPREQAAAAIHAQRCGRCHAPPEPATRSKAELENTFSRHRERVRLTTDEWAAMVEYLATPDGPGTFR